MGIVWVLFLWRLSGFVMVDINYEKDVYVRDGLDIIFGFFEGKKRVRVNVWNIGI